METEKVKTETHTKPQAIVEKPKAQPLANYETSWGLEGVDNKDILIPKLLIMQGLSKLVTEEKAQMGDLVNSVTGEVIGTARGEKQRPCFIIPIKTFKTWVEFKVEGSKKTFSRVVPYDETNAHWKREDTNDQGEKVERDECINFYVLLANQPDSLPYVITFRRTSMRAGKKLATHFKMCELARARGQAVPPAATTFALTGSKVTNDKGTYYVADIAAQGPTQKEALKIAYEWYLTLKQSEAKIKVDNSDLESTDAPVVEDDGRF
jgi:hypothetical protein